VCRPSGQGASALGGDQGRHARFRRRPQCPSGAIIDAQALSTPWRQIALAKLQYAAAYILDKELTARVSTNGQLALDGPTIRKLEDAIGGCREAIIVFRAAANLDWEARTASLLPELLRRSAPGWKVREAEEQAKAIRQQQACYRKTLQD